MPNDHPVSDIGGFGDYQRAANRRPRTIRQRRYILAAAERHIGDLDTATAGSIAAWLDSHDGTQTRSSYLGALRAYYRWAAMTGRCADPTVSLPSPRVPVRVPRPISEPELARALAASAPRMRAWLTLAAYAGLRACEIAPMRGEHIGGGVIYIPEQKGGDAATVPLSPRIVEALAPFGGVGPLWASRELSAGYVSALVSAHFRALGIAGGLHRCRHRFATRFLEASGFDLRATAEACRHRSPATTMTYTQVLPGRLADISARIA